MVLEHAAPVPAPADDHGLDPGGVGDLARLARVRLVVLGGGDEHRDLVGHRPRRVEGVVGGGWGREAHDRVRVERRRHRERQPRPHRATDQHHGLGIRRAGVVDDGREGLLAVLAVDAGGVADAGAVVGDHAPAVGGERLRDRIEVLLRAGGAVREHRDVRAVAELDRVELDPVRGGDRRPGRALGRRRLRARGREEHHGEREGGCRSAHRLEPSPAAPRHGMAVTGTSQSRHRRARRGQAWGAGRAA